jgi:hypothetical protein
VTTEPKRQEEAPLRRVGTAPRCTTKIRRDLIQYPSPRENPDGTLLVGPGHAAPHSTDATRAGEAGC